MTNDEINRKVAEIMEPMPTHIPESRVYWTSYMAWEFDPVSETWQPLDFCNDIAAAWRCVEWAKERGRVLNIQTGIYDIECLAAFCLIDKRTMSTFIGGGRRADTAPLAIALAFIAAFGGE